MGRHFDADGDGLADQADPDFVDELGGAHPRMATAPPAGLTAETLRTAMGASLPLERYRALLPAFTSALLQAGCTTVNRAAMFCAQIGHESVGLKYARELWGPNAQQKRYEPGTSLARQLGNTQPGDGYRFRGAGWIQNTGRGNFAAVSKWAHGKGFVPSPTYFVDRPDELGSDRYVWVGPVWYWTVARPTLGTQAEAAAVEACTRLINGGTYGLEDRRARFQRCLKLGAALLPGAAPSPTAPPSSRALGTELIVDPIPMSGTGARRWFTDPIGARVVEAGWLSLLVDGPDGAAASVKAWPQKPGGGTGDMKELRAQVRTDGSHTSDRAWFQLPVDTDQVSLQWSVSPGATAYLVPAFRAQK